MARRRRATARVDYRHAPLTATIDDDDFVTTSSDSEDQLSSTSSFAPVNRIDDCVSLLSCSTASSSAAFAAPPPRHQSLRRSAEPSLKGSSRRFLRSPRRRKTTSFSRSLTTSSDIDDDDDELNGSKSSGEIAVTSRRFNAAMKGQSREDELRAARSLFEFRSSDEMRVANDFIDGVWRLYSRRSLYNERFMQSMPTALTSTPSTSLFRLYYSRSEKDFRSDLGRDAGEVVANADRKPYFQGVAGSDQLSVMTSRDVNSDNSDRRLNMAEIVVQCDSVGALEDWNSLQKEFHPLEMIEELTDVTATMSNEDDLKIYIRSSPKTFNDTSDATPGRDTEIPDADVAENRTLLQKPIKAACNLHLENTAVLHTLARPQNETDAIGEKSPGLSTLLTDLLADTPGARTLMEAIDSKSRFSPELIQVFRALLIQSGVGETASVDDGIKMLHPLNAGVDDLAVSGCPPDASKFLHADADRVATTTEHDFGSLETESDILRRLTPRLVVKPRLSCDLESTKPTESVSPNAEDAADINLLQLLKEPICDNMGHVSVSGKQAGLNRNRYRKKRGKESEILRRLTPRLVVKPRLSCDLESTKPIESPNAEDAADTKLHSLKQPTLDNMGCMTSTNSIQTNDFNDDPLSTGETRQRISRKSRGHYHAILLAFQHCQLSTHGSKA